ncbi:hypothetical protein AX14_002737, partial [Amanita brunnescens Koide BX004]
DVDPDQWPDQIPTWSIFHPDNRPRPFFNSVSQSGGPPISTTPAQPMAPAWLPVSLRPAATNAAIIGYAPEYRKVNAEGPLIAPQVLGDHYPPHFGLAAIPGNPIIFSDPGIDDIPYNPNEPYFNARPQIVPPDALATAGVIPYDPNAPYFNTGPTNANVPLGHLTMGLSVSPKMNCSLLGTTSFNLPHSNNLMFLSLQGKLSKLLRLGVPVTAQNYQQNSSATDDEEDDEPANASGPVWGPPWPSEYEDEDDEELEIYTGI